MKEQEHTTPQLTKIYKTTNGATLELRSCVPSVQSSHRINSRVIGYNDAECHFNISLYMPMRIVSPTIWSSRHNGAKISVLWDMLQALGASAEDKTRIISELRQMRIAVKEMATTANAQLCYQD